jgi:hypothetical protein
MDKFLSPFRIEGLAIEADRLTSLLIPPKSTKNGEALFATESACCLDFRVARTKDRFVGRHHAIMFGRGSTPLEKCSDYQVRASLIFGTLICGGIIVGTFFSQWQPEWFLWLIRSFGIVWLVGWWRSHLNEIRRRKCNR